MTLAVTVVEGNREEQEVVGQNNFKDREGHEAAIRYFSFPSALLGSPARMPMTGPYPIFRDSRGCHWLNGSLRACHENKCCFTGPGNLVFGGVFTTLCMGAGLPLGFLPLQASA